MADFNSVVGPYIEAYPNLEFIELETKETIVVHIVNPDNGKDSNAPMPVPFIQKEFDAIMDEAIQKVL